jgi:phosphopantothenate-cysteine ligase
MHRQFSLQPFSRYYSHSTNPFLDLLDVDASSDINVLPAQRPELAKVLAAYKEARESGVLHSLTFVTVNEYLWLLRAVSKELSALRRKALYYLAAAVSDFFLPRQRMVKFDPFGVSAVGTDLSAPPRPSTKSNPGREACS